LGWSALLLLVSECSQALALDLDAAVRFGALLSVARAPRCVAADPFAAAPCRSVHAVIFSVTPSLVASL
jgi:hypothetical protein